MHIKVVFGFSPTNYMQLYISWLELLFKFIQQTHKHTHTHSFTHTYFKKKTQSRKMQIYKELCVGNNCEFSMLKICNCKIGFLFT